MSKDYNRKSEKIINIHRKRKIGSVPGVGDSVPAVAPFTPEDGYSEGK